MGTPTDFTRTYDEHSDSVLRAAAEVLRDRRLAEEVVQDVFLRLWRDGGHDPARGPLGPYLRMLARNRAVDLWRAQRARQRTAARLFDREGLHLVGEDTLEAVACRAEEEVARAAVRRLPDDQRRAIVLAYWGGLSMTQAAELQGIPLGTAKSRVRLALKRLAADPDLWAPADAAAA